MARTITSANSTFTLSADGIFVGTNLEGYSADSAFSADGIEVGVAIMGVDGMMSRGWVPSPVAMTVTLQADSKSIDLFDAIYQYQKSQRETIRLTANIDIPSIGKSYALSNGILTNWQPMSAHGRTQAPVSFTITWGEINLSKTA